MPRRQRYVEGDWIWCMLALLGIFAACYLITSPACLTPATAHLGQHSAPTTATLHMVEWLRVEDVIRDNQRDLRVHILSLSKMLANPLTSRDNHSMALRRLIVAQAKIEALDDLFDDLCRYDLLKVHPEAQEYGVWIKNPLGE